MNRANKSSIQRRNF